MYCVIGSFISISVAVHVCVTRKQQVKSLVVLVFFVKMGQQEQFFQLHEFIHVVVVGDLRRGRTMVRSPTLQHHSESDRHEKVGMLLSSFNS